MDFLQGVAFLCREERAPFASLRQRYVDIKSAVPPRDGRVLGETLSKPTTKRVLEEYFLFFLLELWTRENR